MRWTIVGAAVAGLAVGVGAAVSVKAYRNGVYYSPYSLEEKVHFDDQTAGPFIHYRVVAHIPTEYGKLINITDGGTLWFEDERGTIRNVTVDESRPLAIQRKGRLAVREP